MPKMPTRLGAEWAVIIMTRQGRLVYGPFPSFVAAQRFATRQDNAYGVPEITRLFPPSARGPLTTLLRLLAG